MARRLPSPRKRGEGEGVARRGILHLLTGVGALIAIGPRAWAAALSPTPRLPAGPYYPRVLPKDVDADLARVAGRAQGAKGEILHLLGRVRDGSGRPLVDAAVELWQADAAGHYLAQGGSDPNFQGYGRAETDGEGAFHFRTIRPAAYADRAPHLHLAVSGPGFERVTTQLYFAGSPLNDRDPELKALRNPAARAAVIAKLVPSPDLEPKSLKAEIELVLAHNAVVPA